MAGAGQVFLTILLALLPFIAMPLLWRRMKKVRDGSYREQPQPRSRQPWEEEVGDREGTRLARSNDPNDTLIDLGEKGRHSRWPLDNG